MRETIMLPLSEEVIFRCSRNNGRCSMIAPFFILCNLVSRSRRMKRWNTATHSAFVVIHVTDDIWHTRHFITNRHLPSYNCAFSFCNNFLAPKQCHRFSHFHCLPLWLRCDWGAEGEWNCNSTFVQFSVENVILSCGWVCVWVIFYIF